MPLDRTASIAIFGSGALARAYAGGALAAGRPVLGICSRRTHCPLAEQLELPHIDAQTACTADVLLLCVPDDAIEELCVALSMHANQLVVHGSGTLGLEPLTSATASGAHTGSLHPIMVLTRTGPGHCALQGATAAIDGDTAAIEWLQGFADDLQLQTVRIDPDKRALYHLSAALVGGLLSGLLADAAALWSALGLDPQTGARALGPMVREAGDALSHPGPKQVVMGPVARGDASTIRAHMIVLQQQAPQLMELYQALVHSCLRHVELDTDDRLAIEQALRPTP
jgi:predicted short-subunit dehydrogenase-like oxidoreductase (DUF2520 family)